MKLQSPIIPEGHDSLCHPALLSHIFEAEEAMTNVVRMSPEPVNSLILERDVRGPRLASLLEAAVIEYKIDSDGDLYASDGLDFPVWITIAEDKKLIAFFTFFDAENTLPEDVLHTINDINQTVVLVQFSWHAGRLWGHYWMTYDGSIDVKHFVKMLRRFSGAFVSGIERFRTSVKARTEAVVAPTNEG